MIKRTKIIPVTYSPKVNNTKGAGGGAKQYIRHTRGRISQTAVLLHDLTRSLEQPIPIGAQFGTLSVSRKQVHQIFETMVLYPNLLIHNIFIIQNAAPTFTQVTVIFVKILSYSKILNQCMECKCNKKAVKHRTPQVQIKK